MRVAYIAANFTTPFATETHIAREFEGLGHEVVRIHEQSPLERVKASLPGADLLLYTKCHGLPEAAADLWERLEVADITTASVHLDLYYGLPRQEEIGRDPMWRTSMVFTADGDPAMQAYCEQLGVNHRWLPPAVVSDEAVSGVFRPDLAHDVVFVGKTRGYHEAWPWRREMLAFLRRRYGDRFVVYDHGSGMRDLRLNDLYASAKVVVGDSLCLPGHARYWSDRPMECIGRGGFLLFPRVPDFEEYTGLTDYRHLRYYEIGDTDQLGRMIDFYLDQPEKGRDMAQRGQALVRERHTYAHRISQMLGELGLA